MYCVLLIAFAVTTGSRPLTHRSLGTQDLLILLAQWRGRDKSSGTWFKLLQTQHTSSSVRLAADVLKGGKELEVSSNSLINKAYFSGVRCDVVTFLQMQVLHVLFSFLFRNFLLPLTRINRIFQINIL
jgi:hypothetical protein